MKKIVSVLLVVLLLTSTFANVVLADEAPDTVMMMVQVSDAEHTGYYEVVSQDGDLYFSAEDVAKLTKYTLEQGEKYSYKLGKKCLEIDITTGDVEISVLNYQANIGKPITSNDTYYFPSSQLFPLMNVEYRVEEGVFYVVADEASIWKVLEDLEKNDYLFDLYKLYGETVFSVNQLRSMMVLDGMMNLKMEHLISDGESKGTYHYPTYLSTVAELGQAMENSSLDKKSVESFNQEMETTAVWEELSSYQKVTKLFNGKLPSEEENEEMTRFDTLKSIQDECWSIAEHFQQEPLTGESIGHIRQSYFIALRAAKELYQSQDVIFESDEFQEYSKTDEFTKALNDKIASIDGIIEQLVVSTKATENDLLDTREEDAENIKEFIKEITLITAEKYKLKQVLSEQKIQKLLKQVVHISSGAGFKFKTESQLRNQLTTYVTCAFGSEFSGSYKYDGEGYYVVPAADVHNHIYDVFGIKVSKVEPRTLEDGFTPLKYSGGKYYVGGSDGPLETYKWHGIEETEKGYSVKIRIYDEFGSEYYGQIQLKIESCDNANGMKIVSITQ